MGFPFRVRLKLEQSRARTTFLVSMRDIGDIHKDFLSSSRSDMLFKRIGHYNIVLSQKKLLYVSFSSPFAVSQE